MNIGYFSGITAVSILIYKINYIVQTLLILEKKN